MYLYIILEKSRPVLFIKDNLEENFVFQDLKFEKIQIITGEFYTFYTFKKNEVIHFGGVEYDFCTNERKFFQDLSELKYVESFYYPESKSSFSIYINFLSKYSKSDLEENVEYAELFGDDFLYLSKDKKLYCFCFKFPTELKLP